MLSEREAIWCLCTFSTLRREWGKWSRARAIIGEEAIVSHVSQHGVFVFICLGMITEWACFCFSPTDKLLFCEIVHVP